MTTPFPILSAIIFWPLLGGLLALVVGRDPRQCRWLSLGVAMGELCLVLALLGLDLAPDPASGWLLVEEYPWIDRFGIRYSLGLDGISLVLIGLTALLGVIGVLVSWRQVAERVGLFYCMLLLSLTTIMGVFLATDLFLFYLFWELQLLPMLFLIGIWGHGERLAATLKFFLFNIAGGFLLLAALIGLYLVHGRATGDYSFALAHLLGTTIDPDLGMWLFTGFLLAFAIKIPVVPLHGWLPAAHTEAPTTGSVILAGLLLKTGAYALIRIAIPLFPAAAARLLPLLLVLGVIAIAYASWIAFGQRDMKRLVAYSSMGHMGLIVIGIAVWDRLTLSGALLQMLNHGITTAALFIMVGMLDERFHTRRLADYGGIWRSMPLFGAFFLLFGMSSLGLPGLNNFVGEILILLGVYRAYPLAGTLAMAGVVCTLIYILRLLQETLFGPAREEHHTAPDLNPRELVILVTLAFLVVALGLHPQPVLDLLAGPVARLIDQTGAIALSGRL